MIPPIYFMDFTIIKTVHLLNKEFGNEIKQDDILHLESFFKTMQKAIRGGARQFFDHSTRITYFRECFVGRDKEDGSENFYKKFPTMKQIAPIEEIQPLKGLSPDAAREAFSRFKVSDDFMEALIEKSEV